MHPKIRWKVEISSAPYDSEWVQKGVLYHRKVEEIISHFDPRTSKIMSTWFGIFKKFAQQRIERSEARGTDSIKLKDLKSPGWVEHNRRKNRPKSSKIDWLLQTAIFQTLFFMRLSVKPRFKKSQRKMINLLLLQSRNSLYSILSIAEFSKIDPSNSDNINFHTSQLPQMQRIAEFKSIYILSHMKI